MSRNPNTQYKWEYVAEEVAWFESFGIHPTQIAKQMGRTIESTATILRRHGRNDLAAPFYDELQYMKTGVRGDRW
jgi:hypothetical protein